MSTPNPHSNPHLTSDPPPAYPAYPEPVYPNLNYVTELSNPTPAPLATPQAKVNRILHVVVILFFKPVLCIGNFLFYARRLSAHVSA